MADEKLRNYVLNQRRLLELELLSDQEETTNATSLKKSNDSIGNEDDKSTSSPSRTLNNLQLDHFSVGLMGRTVIQLSSSSDIGISLEEGANKKEKTDRLLPAHRLTVGDEVEIISKNASKPMGNERGKSGKKSIGGVISALTDSAVSISLFSKGDGPSNNNTQSDEEETRILGGSPPFSVIPRSSIAVHRKMTDALQELERHGLDHPVAGSVLRAVFDPSSSANTPIPLSERNFVPFNANLDDSQLDAINFALNGQRSISLIHGPPGTGKTTTIAELILQAVQVQKMKVLVTAPSNVAVDNILERLVKTPTSQQTQKRRQARGNENTNTRVRAVRLGHPARIQKSIMEYSLEALVQNNDGTEIVTDIRKELKSYLQIASDPKRKGFEKRSAYREIKQLRKEMRKREEKVVDNLMTNAQVVLSTNVGASSYILDKFQKSSKPFDLVIIDEAAQALEATCWIPILRGKRTILAGDHCQLPPTIKSQKVEVKRELGRTLFQRMMSLSNHLQHTRMLQVQYRMHEDIAGWANAAMYDGKLMNHESVKSRKLFHLPHVSDTNEKTPFLHTVARTSTLLLVDTAGCEMFEQENSAGSRFNEGEADIVAQHVRNLIHIGLEEQEIAVITPYNGQVEVLRSELLSEFPKLEIRSVDGFQGGEREAVVLSLVRSSDRGGLNGIGFLRDERRLNVAVTRAKRHCAVICDCDTVSQNYFLKGLVTWMEDKGEYLSALEFTGNDEQAVVTDLSREVYVDDDTFKGTTVDALKKENEIKSISNDETQVESPKPNKQNESQEPNLEELADRLAFFVEVAEVGEEMEVEIDLSRKDIDRICSEFHLACVSTRHNDTHQIYVISKPDTAKVKIQNDNWIEEFHDQISLFSDIASDYEEMVLNCSHDEQNFFVHQLCMQYGLLYRCPADDGSIIIYKNCNDVPKSNDFYEPQVMKAPPGKISDDDMPPGRNRESTKYDFEELSDKDDCKVPIADPCSSGGNIGDDKDERQHEFEVEKSLGVQVEVMKEPVVIHNSSIEFVGQRDAMVESKGIESVSSASKQETKPIRLPSISSEIKDEKRKGAGTSSMNMNQLLGSLAEERMLRTGHVNKNKKKKSKAKKTKPKETKVKENDNLDDLDDMAFLDAQVDKVQNSHGRKIEGSGNYRTIMNGILIAKPKAPEKKKDQRASSTLNTKIKQAQKNRRAKKK